MFDKQIIEKLRQGLGFKDPGIFEKSVYALNLLPSLLEAYPNLIFKGGTSILLHQYPPVRLSIDEIKKAFANAVEQENGFRESRFTREDVIGDILDVAWKYSQWMVKGADNSFKEISSINRGLERISNHLVGGVDSAELKAIFGKIAYILRLLRIEKSGKIIKDIDVLSVQDMRFEEKYKILEKLKVISPEAYFYWALAVGVYGG